MEGRALAVGSLIVAAAIGGSSDATASRPAITITTTPTVQKLESQIVGRVDATTHKAIPELVLGTATFEVVVANTGDVELADVTVDDPVAPTCNHRIGTLAPGDSVSYVCHRRNVGRDFVNRLRASGLVPDGLRTLAGAMRATGETTAAVAVKAPHRKSRIPHLPRTFRPRVTG